MDFDDTVDGLDVTDDVEKVGRRSVYIELGE